MPSGVYFMYSVYLVLKIINPLFNVIQLSIFFSAIKAQSY